MNKRPRRWLRRLVVGVVLFVVLVLVGFTWLAYWPLEGSVEKIETLVPAEVDFVLRATWTDLKSSEWIRENLLDEAFLPEVAAAVEAAEKDLLPQLRRAEKQVNDAIPLGITTFGVEDDLLPAEVIVAGRICRGWGPERGPPWTREVVLLTRVTWKVKFALAALKHGFVRSMVAPGLGEIDEVDAGVYRFVLSGVRVSPVRSREGCEAGFVIPPENEWYGTRVRDIAAFGNSRELVAAVAELGRADDPINSFGERRGVRLEVPPGGVAAALDMGSLHGYLIRAVEMHRQPVGILQRFLTIGSLDRLNGTLRFPSTDQVLGEARIPFIPSKLARGVGDVYDLPAEPLRTGIPDLLPADDTFAVLLLSTPPLHLLRAFFEDALTPSEQGLIRDNLRRNQTGYTEVDALFADLAVHLGNRAAFALGRISSTFDRVEFPEWYSDPRPGPGSPVGNPSPMPGVALMVPLRQGANADEVDAFLAKQVPALGFRPEITRATHGPYTYSRLELEQRSADYALASPAYMLVQDHLILANNEDWFRKILDTISGGPSLAREPTFAATMAALPESGHLGVFVDLSKIYRIPPDASPGSMPRGYLWDRRNLWVILEKDAESEAREYYEKRAAGRNLSESEQEALFEEADAHKRRWMERYPSFLEEYRQELEDHRALRSFGMAFAASRDTLDGAAVMLLQRREAAPRGR